MKKLLFALLVLPFTMQAQSLIGGKNIVKVNLSSLALRNYHFIYERSIAAGGRVTLSLGYRTMSKGNLPFQSNIESLFNNDPNLNFGAAQIGGYAITPEVRFYARKMKGFYLAPYARYTSLDVAAPFKYTFTAPTGVESKQVVTNGRVTSLSGGLMLGTQHQLFKKLVLDIWIIGAHFGSITSGEMSGTYNAYTNANALIQSQGQTQERQAVQDAINTVNVDPFKIKGTVTVNNNIGRADVVAEGPWLGIRALGVTLGLRF
jgi:hypothetical protein